MHVPMMETMVAFNLVDHLWHGVFGEPEKGLGYPRMLTPYRRPYATSGRACLPAGDDRPAVAQPVRRARSPRTGRRSALFDDRRPHRQYRRALHDRRRDRMRTAHAPPNGASGSTRFDVPNGVVNDLAGLVADPCLNETGFFVPVEHPTEGPTRDDGDRPGEFSRSKPDGSACRRRGSASTTRKCSPSSATAPRDRRDHFAMSSCRRPCQPRIAVLAAILAERRAALRHAVEVDHRRIVLAEIIGVEPGHDDRDVVLARAEEILAGHRRQIELVVGGIDRRAPPSSQPKQARADSHA